MNKITKKRLFVALGIIILFVAIISIYSVSRKVALKNNEILFSFEQNDPTVYISEYSDITYYEYDCDNGHVVFQYEPYPVTVVRDNKRGFVKEYRYNILYSVIDLRAMAIFDFFRYEHWWPDIIRSDEEMTSIRQLLEGGNYSEISSRYNGKIITTASGAVYVS
jgi:hypothetical protein